MKHLLLASVLSLSTFAFSEADAQVVLTFAAKSAETGVGIPHSYLRISGATEAGEAVHRTFGYMPAESSPLMVFGDRVKGAVIDEPEAGIEWDRVTPFLSVQVPDATLDAVIVRFLYWNENQNGGYDAYSQNCIAFLADIARTIGLKVPPGSHLSPSGFLETLAELNPSGSFSGLLDAPVPNPSPAYPAPQEPDAPTAVPPQAQTSVIAATPAAQQLTSGATPITRLYHPVLEAVR